MFRLLTLPEDADGCLDDIPGLITPFEKRHLWYADNTAFREVYRFNDAMNHMVARTMDFLADNPRTLRLYFPFSSDPATNEFAHYYAVESWKQENAMRSYPGKRRMRCARFDAVQADGAPKLLEINNTNLGLISQTDIWSEAFLYRLSQAMKDDIRTFFNNRFDSLDYTASVELAQCDVFEDKAKAFCIPCDEPVAVTGVLYHEKGREGTSITRVYEDFVRQQLAYEASVIKRAGYIPEEMPEGYIGNEYFLDDDGALVSMRYEEDGGQIFRRIENRFILTASDPQSIFYNARKRPETFRDGRYELRDEPVELSWTSLRGLWECLPQHKAFLGIMYMLFAGHMKYGKYLIQTECQTDPFPLPGQKSISKPALGCASQGIILWDEKGRKIHETGVISLTREGGYITQPYLAPRLYEGHDGKPINAVFNFFAAGGEFAGMGSRIGPGAIVGGGKGTKFVAVACDNGVSAKPSDKITVSRIKKSRSYRAPEHAPAPLQL
jgi:hypothetical protein